jgi:hypothetical protein
LYAPSEMSKFDFGPRFCREYDSLVNWNEIRIGLCLNCIDYHLGVFIVVLTFISATDMFRKIHKK